MSFSKQSLHIIIENNANASDSTFREVKSKNQRDYKNKERVYVIEKHEKKMQKSYNENDEYYHEQNSNLDYYDSSTYIQDQLEAEINFFIFSRIFRCKKCKTRFSSNNQLHRHLRKNNCTKKSLIFQHDREKIAAYLIMNISIVEFAIDFFKDIDIDFEFRDWIYVKVMISLFIKNYETQVCLDTECSVILANRKFIKINESHYIIRRMITSLNVQELNINKHQTSKYIIVIIYFTSILNNKSIRDMIRREVHLIDELKINMLIDNDILELEDMFIDETNSKITIASCNNMIISIEIKTLSKKSINKVLHACAIIMIFFHSMIIISIHNINLLFNRDFLFESNDIDISFYAHTIDNFIIIIMTKNFINKIVKISRNDRLEKVTKIQYFNAFHADSDANLQNYVEKTSRHVHKIFWFNRVLKTTAVVYMIVIVIFTSNNQKIIHKNDVIIYNFTSQTIASFSKLVDQYSNLWKNEEFVNLFQNQWMRIFLRSDWEIRIFEKVKIYFLKIENKKLMNQIFDDLQMKKRLKYITTSTFFNYSVFVVWKLINDKKKKRVVINIRNLNVITLFDVYFLSLQSNIISTIKRCNYLFVIDCASFFYQWRIHSKNRHKLIVVFHRDQKTF